MFKKIYEKDCNVGYLQEGHNLAYLYGNEFTLDSLKLVTFIIDIESFFQIKVLTLR